LVQCRYSLDRHVTIGTPVVILAVLTVFWLFLTIGTLLVHSVGTVLIDMWRLVHQWSFLLFWLSFGCFWRLVHCWYSVGTVLIDMWRFVHHWSFLLFWLSFDCFWRLVHCWYTVATVLVDMWRLVHQWSFSLSLDCLLTVFDVLYCWSYNYWQTLIARPLCNSRATYSLFIK